MNNPIYKDHVTTAARKILSKSYMESRGAVLNEIRSYGKDRKVQQVMDLIQELELGEQYTELFGALAEWSTTTYGDLGKLRGPDNPLGSQTNLRSWKTMAHTFDKLADLEWGDDPEEEPEAEEPEVEVEEDTSVAAGSVAGPDMMLGKKEKKEPRPKLGTAARQILGQGY